MKRASLMPLQPGRDYRVAPIRNRDTTKAIVESKARSTAAEILAHYEAVARDVRDTEETLDQAEATESVIEYMSVSRIGALLIMGFVVGLGILCGYAYLALSGR